MKNFNKVIPYIIAIAVFALASIIYFHPVLKGQKLNQSDITQFRGMVKDINDFRADKNTEPYWIPHVNNFDSFFDTHHFKGFSNNIMLNFINRIYNFGCGITDSYQIIKFFVYCYINIFFDTCA